MAHEVETNCKYLGKIKFFCRRRGYGFIVTDSIDEDIFFHFSSMIDKQEEVYLKPELFLMFDVFKGPRGLHAKNIIYLEGRSCKLNMKTHYKKFIHFLGDIINEEIKNKKSNNKI